MTHLREEIPNLLGLDCYDSAELMKLWLKTEEVAKGAAHPNQFVSLLTRSGLERFFLGGVGTLTQDAIGRDNSMRARLCRHNLRRGYPQLPTSTFLRALPCPLLVCSEAQWKLEVLSLRYVGEAQTLASGIVENGVPLA